MAYITKKQTNSGVKPIGSNLYGTCSTASATASKVVSMPDFDVLVEGVTIHVYFANDNTASNPTLQVGSATAKPIKYNGQQGGSWEAGGFISFTYHSDAWHQNDITIGGVTYTFSISGHTLTISGSDGSTQTVTIPDDDTTYAMTISDHSITLTDSNGGTQTVTVPDNNTTYSLSKSGNDITLTGSDGTTDTVTLDNMFLAAYGKSTYDQVLAAYKENRIVYCRAGTGSNPATGNQLRMAFLAYVNNEATPTEFEFQYYRSVATHTDAQQGDQVYVYKLHKTNGWSVTVRSAFTKIVAGTGLQSSYSNGTLTISLA